ncbi:MAG: hypothetical protein LBV33_00870 [Lachnospiraceae bacterium]|jgi:hypothetical protein|nr:hypothetical protein [Lachnospiraceae bacterium]
MSFLDNLGKMVKKVLVKEGSDSIEEAIEELRKRNAQAFPSDQAGNPESSQQTFASNRADEQASDRSMSLSKDGDTTKDTRQRWDPNRVNPGNNRNALKKWSKNYKRCPNSLTNGDIFENFKTLLLTDFSSFEIRQDIPATEIGGLPAYYPYTFGLYREGEPQLFIMLTIAGNQYYQKAHREARELCAQKNIKYLNFFCHFQNERYYVYNRIRENL